MPEKIERTEVIAAEPAESLAAMLDIELPHAAGDKLAPLWHWTYLLERSSQRSLGYDGHPVVGIPAPPEEGRRRMFAGGRVTTLRALEIGKPATKVTSIAKSVDKDGRTGRLTFTTVLQEIFQNDELVIREEQDIVYRVGGSSSLPAPPVPPAPPAGPKMEFSADERLLFRFSALTYNAHRIHYDVDFCRVEGYDGLVIHGPLLAFLMGDHMRREGIDLTGKTFGYRLVSPMTRPQTFSIVPGQDGLEKGAEARSAAGAVCAVSTLSEA
ncbi:mesaconyl-C4 CoA hydratase [Nocardia sp. NPDC051750]|uniref:mesaconyl-C4 CoA hydratase n=1 Tax=Nocardia sp. NPDC051750 TaxID=3364325 RepID=UPI0037B8F043